MSITVPAVSHHVHYMQGFPIFDPPQLRDAIVHSTTADPMAPNLVLTLGGPEDLAQIEAGDNYRPAVPYDADGAPGTWRWPPTVK